MAIKDNLLAIKAALPSHVTLVAVSKTMPVPALMEAYESGQRIFGENKIQEMAGKFEQMPKDVEWHMIGHVQSNKIKYMAPFVSLVHGVDSLHLLQEISRHAEKHHRTIRCLLQVHIAEEATKFGLNEIELEELMASQAYKSLNNIKVIGLMGMATFTENQNIVKTEFTFLKTVFDRARLVDPELSVLSMGMSGDYKTAIECGSTMVRIGSSIFGTRN